MPSVLIVGDSHVDPVAGPSAGRLRKALQGAGWTVNLSGVGSTSTGSWSGQKACKVGGKGCVELDSLPKGTDLLLICLGTNDAANASAGGYKGKFSKGTYFNNVVDRVAGIAKRFGARRTVWILPPYQRGNHKHYTQPAMELLYEAAPRATSAGIELFDSRPVTQKLVQGGDGDGIHLGKKGSDAWASAIAQYLGGKAQETPSAAAGVSPAKTSMVPLLLGGAALLGVLIWRRFSSK